MSNLNSITIYNPKVEEIQVFKCGRKNSYDGEYTNTEDIENIKNKLAKRIIELTKNDSIEWAFDTEDLLLRNYYIKFKGIGKKGKTINFKYVLYIHTKEIIKSYFMYVSKNAVNDWEHLYPADVEGNCLYNWEQELFLIKILDILEKKGVLVWLPLDIDEVGKGKK